MPSDALAEGGAVNRAGDSNLVQAVQAAIVAGVGQPTPEAPVELTRRNALAAAIALVAGAAMGPAACSRPLEQGFFNAREMPLLEDLCETILPATDTPGARAANVHGFIDGMMQTWASEDTRTNLRALLRRLDGEALGFARRSGPEQAAFVQRFDAAAFAPDDKAWSAFKKLVLLGYYTSEIGATQELAYLPVPGDWKPDVRLTPEMRAWAE